MEEPSIIPQRVVDESPTFWGEHRLILLLIGTILIATVLTTVSVVIYNTSGAAQLDLSRPGYLSVSDQVEHDTTVGDYSASGPINAETIREFIKLYDEQAEKAKGVDAFNGDPLNPELLYSTDSSAAQ
ncbi:hypothetical protein LRY29_02220 [Candidatus Saccharibacteria bacterium]|nr:hypothetical protein [Candidatus Saccharibacteria bacterium]